MEHFSSVTFTGAVKYYIIFLGSQPHFTTHWLYAGKASLETNLTTGQLFTKIFCVDTTLASPWQVFKCRNSSDVCSDCEDSLGYDDPIFQLKN